MERYMTSWITRITLWQAPVAAAALLNACGANDTGKPLTLGPHPSTGAPVLPRNAPPVEPTNAEDPDTGEMIGPVQLQPTVPVDPNSPDEILFQEALVQYDAQNYVQAEQLFARLASTYPNSPRTDNAEYLAGRSAYALGIAQVGIVDVPALNRAAAEFTSVFLQFPNSPFALASHYYLGRIHFTQGNFDPALLEFQSSVSDPTATFSDNAQYYVGRTHFELGDFTFAELELRALLADYPTSSYLDNGTYYLGRALFGLQSYSEALAVFASVTNFQASIFLDNAVYYHGRSNYALGDLANALGDFQALFASYPTSGYRDNALYYRARIQTDQVDCPAAAASLNELSLAFPSSPYVARAQDYLTQGGC